MGRFVFLEGLFGAPRNIVSNILDLWSRVEAIFGVVGRSFVDLQLSWTVPGTFGTFLARCGTV
eukprot:665383-Pyramimonas_sp.AAC.1